MRFLLLILFLLLFSACTINLPSGEALEFSPIESTGSISTLSQPSLSDSALDSTSFDSDNFDIELYYQGMLLGCLRGGLNIAQTLGLGDSDLIQRRVGEECHQVIIRAYELDFHRREIEGWPGIEQLKGETLPEHLSSVEL